VRSINFLFLFGIRRNCLRRGRNRSVYLFIRRAIEQTAVIIGAFNVAKYVQNVIQLPAVKVNSIYTGTGWGPSMCISTEHVQHSSYILHSSHIVQKLEYNEIVDQHFIHSKKAYDSVRRVVLYNILSEFFISMKLERLIKECLTEAYSSVRLGKNLSDMFRIRNGLKKGDAVPPLLVNFA
jgi:hypothetical protein